MQLDYKIQQSLKGEIMSYTVVLLPILAALTAAENAFLGLNTKWIGFNNTQKVFIDKYMKDKDQQLKLLNDGEMKTKASRDISEINAFLKENNFDIQLEKDINGLKPEFATAAIFNILVNWAQEGQITQINANNKGYSAVEINKNFNVYTSSQHINPIIELNTKTDDKVYITVADKSRESFDLLDYIANIKDNTIDSDVIYDKVVFPMVDLNQEVDISWLENMRGVGPKDWADVFQALQQTKFQMDEKGAAAQSAVAISFIKSCCPSIKQTLTIDKPFFIWIERKGLSIPLFAGYIDYVDWKKPNR